MDIVNFLYKPPNYL